MHFIDHWKLLLRNFFPQVIILIPSRGPAVGLLVVEKLLFFALNDDLLTLLSVLIGY